ncbi:hypothetical protein [Streptomyces sp. NPDC002215]|uniref:hypothetical protein n=1 Tax=Streptomyces sp. NPDC002215 TaxID=3154412 RepID=UPI00332D384F
MAIRIGNITLGDDDYNANRDELNGQGNNDGNGGVYGGVNHGIAGGTFKGRIFVDGEEVQQ